MVLNYTSYDHNESTQVQLPEAAGILMVVWVYMDLALPEEPGKTKYDWKISTQVWLPRDDVFLDCLLGWL